MREFETLNASFKTGESSHRVVGLPPEKQFQEIKFHVTPSNDASKNSQLASARFLVDDGNLGTLMNTEGSSMHDFNAPEKPVTQGQFITKVINGQEKSLAQMSKIYQKSMKSFDQNSSN